MFAHTIAIPEWLYPESTAPKSPRPQNHRFASRLVVAASIIAAVRLAREPGIERPSPRVLSAVADSAAFARMVLDKILPEL